jgi:hypothetical protein
MILNEIARLLRQKGVARMEKIPKNVPVIRMRVYCS